MNVIYQPKGPAAEYAAWAVNLFQGCVHGCAYCYAPGTLRQSRDVFHGSCLPRHGILEKLDRDAKWMQRAGITDPVLLCFTCDPYQEPAEVGVTRQAIKTLNSRGIPVNILTKAGFLSRIDFDLLCQHPGNRYGVTLTCDNWQDSRKWEPGADYPEERLAALRDAHQMGIKTWISCEPVLYPIQTLALIRLAWRFCDHIAVGKLNRHPRAQEIDWKAFHAEVVELLKNVGVPYTIKNDLRGAAAR